MGRPKVLTPGDVGLKKIGLGGHGFIALSYNPIMGQKPDFREGTPLPPQVLEERKFQKQQMQDASGDPKNVLKGHQPSANASGVLTEGLRETAERGRYPDIERFNRSLSRVYKKRLLVAQEIMTEERLIKTLGRGNKVKVQKFKASDLRGTTDVRLELDSGLIQAKSGQSQMFLQMIQTDSLKKGKVSPSIRQEILQRMVCPLSPTKSTTMLKEQRRRTYQLLQGTQSNACRTQSETGEDEVLNLDQLFKYDDHGAHFETHRKYIISPEFSELPEQYQTILIAHADLHQKMIQDKPVDIREYVQIDKILLPGVLKESERAQVVEKYLGIQPGQEPVVGIPDADTIVKSKQKMASDEQKVSVKDRQIKADLIKTGMTNAIQSQKSEGRGEGSKPKQRVQ